MTTAAIDPGSLAEALSRPAPVDTESAPYMGVSAFLHIMFLLLAMIVPPGAATMDLDDVSQENRFVSIATSGMQKEPEPFEESSDKAFGGQEKTAKHAGEEGDAGEPDAEQTDKRMAIEGPPDNASPQVARAVDRQIASQAGIVGVFGNTSSSMWSGDSDQSIGNQATTALGEMQGADIGASKGIGGFGITGTGRGGGGDDKSFGMHDVDTTGPGGPGGDGGGRPPRADIGEKDDKLPPVVPGPPAVDGPLDRKIIQRVVRRHRREIAYCYESQLQRNPRLEGRVVMKFMIDGNGNVVSAMTKSSTMNNRTVEGCLANKIRHWNFPAPSTTGIVTVNYPFKFSRQD